MVPPWVTASQFLAGNREAELKLTTFSSLIIIIIYILLVRSNLGKQHSRHYIAGELGEEEIREITQR